MKRLFKYLPLALLTPLFVSCDKDNGASPQDTSGAASYDEQDWEWKKLPNGGGLQIDTAWDGETTIIF
ncbi:MAG: hypothetical protein IKP34_06795 [Bacteroidales bacterium]|nr:hypothetical protein [Bacteroidales bacterium]